MFHPSAIKFFDLFGDLTGEFDAYGLDAFTRDGAAVLATGGSVHFDVAGKAYFYRGHFPETREAGIDAFRAHMGRLAAQNDA